MMEKQTTTEMEMPKEVTGCIYRCTHIDTGRCYIGQSTEYEQRKKHHLMLSRLNPHYDRRNKFHNCIRKYGEDAFNWDILYTVTAKNIDSLRDGLDWLESYEIDSHDSRKNGLNITVGGRSLPYGSNRNAKPIYQCKLDGTLIKEWSSAVEASETTGVHESTINSCCKGRGITAGGFIWEYVDEDARNDARKKRLQHKYTRLVIQMTTDKEVIKVWGLVKEAAEALGLHRGNINRAVLNEHNTAGGFLWKYEYQDAIA